MTATRKSPGMTLQYSHPFTLQELHELDTNLVSEEIQRLQKSLAMLHATNATLGQSLASSSSSATSPSPFSSSREDEHLSPEDAQLFKDTISENEESIAAQKERIQMCTLVLKSKLGIDPTNKHYELDQDTTAVTAVHRPAPVLAGLVAPPPSSSATANQGQGQTEQTDAQVEASRLGNDDSTNTARSSGDMIEEQQDEGGMYL